VRSLLARPAVRNRNSAFCFVPGLDRSWIVESSVIASHAVNGVGCDQGASARPRLGSVRHKPATSGTGLRSTAYEQLVLTSFKHKACMVVPLKGHSGTHAFSFSTLSQFTERVQHGFNRALRPGSGSGFFFARGFPAKTRKEALEYDFAD
jgi:hypothetical protein